MQRNGVKCREMKRNAEKCRELQRNSEKFRDILMIFMTFMTQGNVIFNILEAAAFRKFSTCWVLQKFEEPCRTRPSKLCKTRIFNPKIFTPEKYSHPKNIHNLKNIHP